MKIQDKPTFSIVVPLFNEEENVNLLVQTILESVGSDPEFLEIVLVDDGSKDSTAALALELAADDDRIRLIQHERNQGLGAAIRTGLSVARGKYVLYTDADLPFDFSLIPQLMSMASENCVVSGYRLNRGEGLRRLILTKCYNSLIWLLFGLHMSDVNFACKIFPRRFLQQVDFDSLGSFIDVEILLEARRFGLEIVEHPLVYYPRERGLSTLSRPQVIFFILQEMFGYLLTLFSEQTGFRDFVKNSPLAKILVCSTTAATSLILLSENIWSFKEGAWALLAFETGIISLLLGWRTGLLSSMMAVAAIKLCLSWQNRPFFIYQNYYFLIGALLVVLISEFIYRFWKSANRTHILSMFE